MVKVLETITDETEQKTVTNEILGINGYAIDNNIIRQFPNACLLKNEGRLDT